MTGVGILFWIFLVSDSFCFHLYMVPNPGIRITELLIFHIDLIATFLLIQK